MIFVFFSIANKEEAAVSGNKIIVSSAEIERLGYNWSKRWRSIIARRLHLASIRMIRSYGEG
jgi:hypothetical protein